MGQLVGLSTRLRPGEQRVWVKRDSIYSDQGR